MDIKVIHSVNDVIIEGVMILVCSMVNNKIVVIGINDILKNIKI